MPEKRRDFYLNALNNKTDIEESVAIFQEDFEEEWCQMEWFQLHMKNVEFIESQDLNKTQ
jgi:hypothetical protein